MKLTNWLKSNRNSKKETEIGINIHCDVGGQIGESKWNEYVQFKFYSIEENKFVLLSMTVDEAKNFQKDFNKSMKVYDEVNTIKKN